MPGYNEPSQKVHQWSWHIISVLHPEQLLIAKAVYEPCINMVSRQSRPNSLCRSIQHISKTSSHRNQVLQSFSTRLSSCAVINAFRSFATSLVTAIGLLPTTSSSYKMDHDTIADAIKNHPSWATSNMPRKFKRLKDHNFPKALKVLSSTRQVLFPFMYIHSQHATKNNQRTTSCIPASDFLH